MLRPVRRWIGGRRRRVACGIQYSTEGTPAGASSAKTEKIIDHMQPELATADTSDAHRRSAVQREGGTHQGTHRTWCARRCCTKCIESDHNVCTCTYLHTNMLDEFESTSASRVRRQMHNPSLSERLRHTKQSKNQHPSFCSKVSPFGG